jgi:hypothetical protein
VCCLESGECAHSTSLSRLPAAALHSFPSRGVRFRRRRSASSAVGVASHPLLVLPVRTTTIREQAFSPLHSPLLPSTHAGINEKSGSTSNAVVVALCHLQVSFFESCPPLFFLFFSFLHSFGAQNALKHLRRITPCTSKSDSCIVTDLTSEAVRFSFVFFVLPPPLTTP